MIRSRAAGSNDEAREIWRVRATGELLGEALSLTAGSGLEGFSVHHERLAPGRRASPPHAHSEKEELVYVLGGCVTVWLDGQRSVLHAHDSVAFAAGTGVLHHLSNESDEPAEYLVVSTPAETDHVSFLPPLTGAR